MKGKHLLLPFIAAMAFAGCSENDEPVPNDGENDLKDCGYISVTIAQPTSDDGRSDDDALGTDEENAVKSASFFIYKVTKDTNENKTYTFHSSQNLGEDSIKASETTPLPNQVSKLYDAVLVVDLNKDGGQAFDGEIFCVLNPPAEIKDLADPIKTPTGPDKDVLLQKIADYSATDGGKFIMSNSIYGNVRGTAFSQDQLKETAVLAKGSPVEVFVERVVAKVKATTSAEFKNNGAKPFNPEATTADYKIRITGIEIANVAPIAGLFKCIDNTTTDYFQSKDWPDKDQTWSLQDETNFRCYWENVPVFKGGNNGTNYYINKSYSALATKPNDSNLYNDIFVETPADGQKYGVNLPATYIQPNTSTDSLSCILVTAQLVKEKTENTTTTYEPADLVWLMGRYSTNESALSLLCNYLKTESYALEETVNGATEYNSIEPKHLFWRQKQIIKKGEGMTATEDSTAIVGLKDHQAVAQLNIPAGSKVVKKNADGTYTEAKYEANAYLAGDEKFRAEVFVNGLCYYFKYIDHTNVISNLPTTGVKPFYGVVRNHYYNLNLTGIEGIGTAVFDPDKKIIPEEPDHDNFRYLAARVNVLKWKIVSQEIHF